VDKGKPDPARRAANKFILMACLQDIRRYAQIALKNDTMWITCGSGMIKKKGKPA
jgi:hypothetical protein